MPLAMFVNFVSSNILTQKGDCRTYCIKACNVFTVKSAKNIFFFLSYFRNPSVAVPCNPTRIRGATSNEKHVIESILKMVLQ